jgi:DNA-binding transcriptional ArsR family regulator
MFYRRSTIIDIMRKRAIKTASSKSLQTRMKEVKTMPDVDGSEKLAQLSKGISHPMRLEIIRMLAHKPAECPCFCGKIVEALPLAQSSVSQHLKILRETGWVEAKPMGTSMCYCLVDGILDFYKNLMDKVIIYN